VKPTLEQVAKDAAPLLAALVRKYRSGAAVAHVGGTGPARLVGEQGTSSGDAA
jgi:hypothetical protein